MTSVERLPIKEVWPQEGEEKISAGEGAGSGGASAGLDRSESV